jgi:hypothetical protein
MPVAGLTPVPANTLAQFEARHCLTLPEDYKAFLLVLGAGSPEPDCYRDSSSGAFYYLALIFDPADDRMAAQCFAFPPPAETGFLTIGTNAGGDYFLLSLATGAVYYWDHELHDVEVDPNEVVCLAPSLLALVARLSSAPDLDVGMPS